MSFNKYKLSLGVPESVCCVLWKLAYDIDKDAEDQNMYIDGMVRSSQDDFILFIKLCVMYVCSTTTVNVKRLQLPVLCVLEL